MCKFFYWNKVKLFLMKKKGFMLFYHTKRNCLSKGIFSNVYIYWVTEDQINDHPHHQQNMHWNNRFKGIKKKKKSFLTTLNKPHSKKSLLLNKRKGTDTQTDMLRAFISQRNMRSKIRWFTEFCNSHYVSQFAAFFIDARAQRSTVKSCHIIFFCCVLS